MIDETYAASDGTFQCNMNIPGRGEFSFDWIEAAVEYESIDQEMGGRVKLPRDISGTIYTQYGECDFSSLQEFYSAFLESECTLLRKHVFGDNRECAVSSDAPGYYVISGIVVEAWCARITCASCTHSDIIRCLHSFSKMFTYKGTNGDKVIEQIVDFCMFGNGIQPSFVPAVTVIAPLLFRARTAYQREYCFAERTFTVESLAESRGLGGCISGDVSDVIIDLVDTRAKEMSKW